MSHYFNPDEYDFGQPVSSECKLLFQVPLIEEWSANLKVITSKFEEAFAKMFLKELRVNC